MDAVQDSSAGTKEAVKRRHRTKAPRKPEEPLPEAQAHDEAGGETDAGPIRRRKAIKGRLYVCRAIDSPHIDSASQFEVIDGPFKGKRQALQYVRTLGDGEYALMFHKLTVTKSTKTATRILINANSSDV
jgi:hypothetical protein